MIRVCFTNFDQYKPRIVYIKFKFWVSLVSYSLFLSNGSVYFTDCVNISNSRNIVFKLAFRDNFIVFKSLHFNFWPKKWQKNQMNMKKEVSQQTILVDIIYNHKISCGSACTRTNSAKNSKWVWSGNTTITNSRQIQGTARKSHTTITRHQEDKLNREASSLFPIKMIAKLKGT